MYREAFLLEKAPTLGELAAKQTERFILRRKKWKKIL